MAQITLDVGTHYRWWVAPLVSILIVIKRAGASFDEELISERIVRYGVVFTIDGKRVQP